jgi:hypothetical protein
MGIDLANFAFSFGHAVLKVDGRQFTDISAVSINQDLSESPVYGTDPRPLKRSLGQISLGRGQFTFSDMGEALDFWRHLGGNAAGGQPMMQLWQLDYSLVKSDGTLRSVECLSCRLTSFGIEHSAGADALGMSFPFSFLQCRIDGIDLALDAKRIIQTGLGVAQNLVGGLL